jgi:hypothetical protein
MKTIKPIITAIAVVCGSSLLSANSYYNDNTPLLTKLLCAKQAEDFNDAIYSFWLKDSSLPDTTLLQKQLESQFDYVSDMDFNELKAGLTNYYKFLTEELSTEQSNNEKLKTLTALEVGDNSSPEMETLQGKWTQHKSNLKKIQEKFSYLCENQYKPIDIQNAIPGPILAPTPPSGLSQALWGLRVAFAATYQSCKVLDLPAMDEGTEPVDGIAISGTHSNGVGKKRVYKNIPRIFDTHYYYKNILPLEKSCYLPAKQPLIYDYGGKPATSSDTYSTLDLFTNQGSGTSVLGIDCSGFVFSALARGGLRIAPAKPLKAALVHGISAKMFKDPQKNGLTCFNPVTLSAKQHLIGGEVVGAAGHVIMIDDVGSDPFGVSNIKNLADCDLKHISYENFHFSIVQSSPFKNAVGIGKSKARAYLRESTSMRAGFEKYAVAACQAQFGKAQTPRISEITIIRSKGTPECINDNYIALEREACVASCRY